MPWKRDDPDPLEARRRQLAEQVRALDEQRRKLAEEIQGSGVVKRAEPLVWRNDDNDTPISRAAEPTPSRRRHLARQRQRDMIAAVGLIILFLIVVGLVVWIAYVHNIAPGNT
jgi:hypothetical protein